jgi:hypothetical protein
MKTNRKISSKISLGLGLAAALRFWVWSLGATRVAEQTKEVQ